MQTTNERFELMIKKWKKDSEEKLRALEKRIGRKLK